MSFVFLFICFLRVNEHFVFVSELIEDNKKNELSELEENNHVKRGEKPKQKDVMKGRAKKSFTCTQCGKSVRN